ncbi:hypothetical protein ACVWYN_002227 [Pedobacter sp. UYP24]
MIKILLIPMLLLAVLGAAVYSLFFKNRKLKTSFNQSAPDTETILLSPLRINIISLAMIGVGAFFVYVIISSFQSLSPGFRDSITYIFFGLFIITSGIGIYGIRLFLKRNNLIQLQFEKDGIRYLAVDWFPSKKRTFFLLLKQKFIFLEYVNMRSIEIDKSLYFGNSIIIRTTYDSIYLPFLYENKGQMEYIADKLKSKLIK